MRFSAIILALYVSLLAVYPRMADRAMASDTTEQEVAACPAEDPCATSCCRPANAHEPAEKESPKGSGNCCDSGTCNPLVQCCCCVGMVADPPQFVFGIIAHSKQDLTGNTPAILTSLCEACFHPPEMT